VSSALLGGACGTTDAFTGLGANMTLIPFSQTELPLVLGAARAVEPHPSPAQDDMLRAIARLRGVRLTPAALPRPRPQEIATVVVDARARERLLELAIVLSGMDGQVSAIPTANVSQLSRALGIDEARTRRMRHVSQHHHMLTRIDLMRRLGGRSVKNAWRDEGWSGVERMLGPLPDLAEDRGLAARYWGLANCPSGSLGRAVFDHYRANAFRFPGERFAIPEVGVFHDVGHVLSGYGTDAASEVLQAAFQAGFVTEGGLSYLLFGIVQFDLGVKVMRREDPELGRFDVAQVLDALERGAGCRVDLSTSFDLFQHASRPLDAVRAELGIHPIQQPDSARLVA
jgi:hypothetical protein